MLCAPWNVKKFALVAEVSRLEGFALVLLALEYDNAIYLAHTPTPFVCI